MTRINLAAVWGAVALSLAAAAPSQGICMPAPVVFFDIASTSLDKQAAFYKSVFDWDIGPGGGFSVPVASPLPGNLRVEAAGPTPVEERVIYIGVPDVTAALAKIVANGGSVVFPRLVVPGVAVVGMFKDPGGNSMGLVELDGAKAKVPPKAP